MEDDGEEGWGDTGRERNPAEEIDHTLQGQGADISASRMGIG